MINKEISLPNPKEMSRRDFLRWAFLGLAGAGLTAATGGCVWPQVEEIEPIATKKTAETPPIITPIEVTKTSEAPELKSYTRIVEPKDTLPQIVANFNTENEANFTWQEIAQFNNLDNFGTVYTGQEIIFPVEAIKIPEEQADILFFGSFWEYKVNPSKPTVEEIERIDLLDGYKDTIYKELVVDYSQAVEVAERFVRESDSDIVFILAVGGSEDTTQIETSAGNRWPDPLPEGFNDPYNISQDMAPIFPDEPIHQVRSLPSAITQEIKDFIGVNGWEDLVVANSGPAEGFNTPCNAALYALLRACEKEGKIGFLLHLPRNIPVAVKDAPKIVTLIEYLSRKFSP